ncbi:probable glutathione peroxidase 4 [Andrographis paniculata]|uniref:probable glutathione peroxidase 4 n=1 Tax=Andrographis paniculata TaxID=175694 RepID=UPI0021E70B99|nr:probable glutathione peroxidase 4 [Andrographis paniculata]
MGGSDGLFAQKTLEISDEILATYKNQGGYDLLGRTKDQIRTIEQVNAAFNACTALKLNALVIIGGIPVVVLKTVEVEILAFPCNQFLYQEPGPSEKAEEFACTRFKAEYPIFQKVKVNGPDAAPVYKFLKAQKGGVLGSRIKWNFTKFLVDKEGRVVKRYGPTTSPFAIEADIKKAVGEI